MGKPDWLKNNRGMIEEATSIGYPSDIPIIYISLGNNGGHDYDKNLLLEIYDRIAVEPLKIKEEPTLIEDDDLSEKQANNSFLLYGIS